MIKNQIKKYIPLSDKGVDDVLKAAIYTFLKNIMAMLPPVLVFVFLDDLIRGNVKPLYVYMLILLVIAIVMFFILMKEYVLTYDTTYAESTAMRLEIAEKIKQLPMSYFAKHDLADLSQSVMMDVNNLEMTISHALPQGIGFFYFLVLLTVLFFINNPLITLTIFAPIYLSLIFFFVSDKFASKSVKKFHEHLIENANSFQEAFEMQQEIKSYSMQEKVKEEVLKKLEDTERIQIKSEFTMAFILYVADSLPYLGPILTAIVGANMYLNGNISLLYYMGYLMAATAIASKYSSFNVFIATALIFKNSFKRLRDLKGEKVQSGTDTDIEKFDIEFKNVKFAYRDKNVIDDVSFKINQGEIVAFVGPSGCGKTTILRLVSRLYDYDSGEIKIGGKNIKDISTKSLFKNVSIVFQNIDLFDNTILENIRIGRKDATDEEVIEAAKLANVDKIAENLPHGYNTLIGENGSRLSGGERQRISIARAFLKDAPIILLDEISASIDIENEKEIQSSISKLIKDKTVMIISHRLKSIEKADKIIVVNEGRIDNIGSHEELIKNSKIYRDMIEKSNLTDEFVY